MPLGKPGPGYQRASSFSISQGTKDKLIEAANENKLAHLTKAQVQELAEFFSREVQEEQEEQEQE